MVCAPVHQGATLILRYFSDNVAYVQYAYVILPYVNRTLTSLYD